MSPKEDADHKGHVDCTFPQGSIEYLHFLQFKNKPSRYLQVIFI